MVEAEFLTPGPATRGQQSGLVIKVLICHSCSILPLFEGGGDLRQSPYISWRAFCAYHCQLPFHWSVNEDNSLDETVRLGCFVIAACCDSYSLHFLSFLKWPLRNSNTVHLEQGPWRRCSMASHWTSFNLVSSSIETRSQYLLTKSPWGSNEKLCKEL